MPGSVCYGGRKSDVLEDHFQRFEEFRRRDRNSDSKLSRSFSASAIEQLDEEQKGIQVTGRKRKNTDLRKAKPTSKFLANLTNKLTLKSRRLTDDSYMETNG